MDTPCNACAGRASPWLVGIEPAGRFVPTPWLRRVAMRFLKTPVIALPTALVLLIIVTTAAEACFRCRERVVYQPVPVVQQQVVTQVVQVATRPNNENSQVIRALVIIDNNDPDK